VLQAYGDRWLLDAAEEKVDSELLVEAVNDVIAGRADDALQVGEKAVRLYHSAPAHLVRAQLEIVNALNRSMHSEECRARAESVAKGAEAPGYYWIQVQALLQVSSCSGMAGDIRTANEKRREGIRLAGQQRLASLQFRAIGLDTALRTRAGDLWAAWRENRDGLQRASASAVFRIHQSLVNYASATELWGWRAASYAFMKAAADTLHSTPNRITEAADRSRAAGLALEAHLKKEYAEETQKAKELFAALPDSPTRTRYLESVGLLEGKSYLMSNRPGEAVRVLTPVAQAVVLQTEQWQAHQFLGLSLLHTGRRTEAMRQLETAVATLEQRIAKLSRPAERSQARREGLEAYRTLAEALLDQDPSGAQSLRVWLSAHGSNAAPDLVFLEVADGYAVWTQQGARLHHLARDRSKIRSSVRRLLSAAGDPNRPMNEIQTEGRFLYQQLLPPEMGVNAADDVLTVLPDAEIAGIPFELLVGPDGRWMGDCIATVFATHPRNTTELWNPPRRALVIGDPATQERLPPLPESRLEAETIALHFPGSTLITGPRATASAVTLDLERSDLFHYSGHGYAGASVGGLYLSDSLLTSASLQGLSLPACRLAVLAACITAVGQTDGLTNPDSLVHALLDAGVRTAIASRWAVDSAATATLMSRFYPDLDATRDPAKSLANATRSLRADAKYSHPYFWAAFQTYE
jgi:CHAT domain-containing protein